MSAHPPNHHQPALDGIRGLAILAVMLSHAVSIMGVMPYHRPHSLWTTLLSFLLVPGWGGVDLFFTLSGFLITGILLRARNRPTYFRSFYTRRVLRIFPIYYLFLTASLLAAHLFPAVAALLPASSLQRLSFFLYLQNWPLFWPNWFGLTGLWGIYWSLAVEEQFYLLWPTLVRFLHPRALLTICLLGFALGTPLRWFVLTHWTGVTVGLLHFPLARLDGLFLGAALALYRELRGRAVPIAWAQLAFALGALLFLSIGLFHIEEYFGIGPRITTFGIAAFALMSAGLIAASQHPTPRLTRALTLGPLRLAGRYSYGMYVYHLAVYYLFSALTRRLAPATAGELPVYLALPTILAAILATTAIAALSFHLLEQPFLRLKRFLPSPSAPAANQTPETA